MSNVMEEEIERWTAQPFGGRTARPEQDGISNDQSPSFAPAYHERP